MATRSPWNSLEAAKVLASLIMPVVVVVVGFQLTRAQQTSASIAAAAAEERTKAFEASQIRQAQDFQRELARSQHAFAVQLQKSDLAERGQSQAAELRWRKILQDESAARAAAAHQEDIHRQEEARAADIRRSDIAKEEVAERERKDSVAELSRAILERRIRANLLASALRRRDASATSLNEQEIVARKTNYDEAFAKWNTNLKANLFRVRRVIGRDNFNPVEAVVEFQLGSRLFREIDVCITRAYDRSLQGEPAAPILDACGMTALLQETLDCGYAISEALYQLSTRTASLGPDEEDYLNSQCSVA